MTSDTGPSPSAALPPTNDVAVGRVREEWVVTARAGPAAGRAAVED